MTFQFGMHRSAKPVASVGLGLTRAEGKALLKNVQRIVVAEQRPWCSTIQTMFKPRPARRSGAIHRAEDAASLVRLYDYRPGAA